MSKKLELRYIVLSPDSDNLKEKYLSVGFKKLNKSWMFSKYKVLKSYTGRSISS